jgi:lactoylglutathione lyase
VSENVERAVPFFRVTDMHASLRFYVDGLGFAIVLRWIPESDGREPYEGIRWCRLELGSAEIMLQEFEPQTRPEAMLGAGVSVCFTCKDALALYRTFASRGVRTRRRPSVENGFWVVPLADPDGYRIEFSSPTDAPEEREFEEAT